jgi:hypothetical protein
MRRRRATGKRKKTTKGGAAKRPVEVAVVTANVTKPKIKFHIASRRLSQCLLSKTFEVENVVTRIIAPESSSSSTSSSAVALPPGSLAAIGIAGLERTMSDTSLSIKHSGSEHKLGASGRHKLETKRDARVHSYTPSLTDATNELSGDIRPRESLHLDDVRMYYGVNADEWERKILWSEPNSAETSSTHILSPDHDLNRELLEMDYVQDIQWDDERLTTPALYQHLTTSAFITKLNIEKQKLALQQNDSVSINLSLSLSPSFSYFSFVYIFVEYGHGIVVVRIVIVCVSVCLCYVGLEIVLW